MIIYDTIDIHIKKDEIIEILVRAIAPKLALKTVDMLRDEILEEEHTGQEVGNEAIRLIQEDLSQTRPQASDTIKLVIEYKTREAMIRMIRMIKDPIKNKTGREALDDIIDWILCHELAENIYMRMWSKTRITIIDTNKDMEGYVI